MEAATLSELSFPARWHLQPKRKGEFRVGYSGKRSGKENFRFFIVTRAFQPVIRPPHGLESPCHELPAWQSGAGSRHSPPDA